MGSKPAWDADDWVPYTAASTAASRSSSYTGVYTSTRLDDGLNPRKIHSRESRNSTTNPVTTPVMVGIDTTGSMGSIAHDIVKTGLGVFAKEVYGRKVVPGPHLAFAGIGDLTFDDPDSPHAPRVPFQVTQFESDIKVLEQLLKFAGFGGGGGNQWESYNALWHFAAYHTSADCFEKDNRLGYIFTVGDELCPPDLTEAQLERLYGTDKQEILASNRVLLERLSMMYHVYHIVLGNVGQARMKGAEVTRQSFEDLLGQNVLVLDDSTKLSELIISTMQVQEGASIDDVAKTWSGTTSVTIAKALKGTSVTSATTGITRF